MFSNHLLEMLRSDDDKACMAAMESAGDLLEYGEWSPAEGWSWVGRIDGSLDPTNHLTAAGERVDGNVWT
jgi:hypothetical protein